MRSLLDHQADGIEYTLHSHGIEGNVVGGNISPRLIQFHLKIGSGVKYSRVRALEDEIALALGVISCRISRDGHYVKVEVPRPDPVAVQLFPLMRSLPGDLPFHSPILGLDENGVPLLVRLTSPDIAHILISGTTGSGKTALARSMIASLALQNPAEQLRLLLIDPKSRGYKQFNGLPNLVCPVITDPLDGLHRLRWVVRHMEKRNDSGVNSPALIVFIDELADLMMVNGREMETLVTRLTQRGREAGIHLIACTQKPAASVIGGIAKSNFPTRIVGKVVSAEDARVASGVPGSGAEKLMGRGDFLLFSSNTITRLQAAYISPSEMEQTVVHLGGTLERPVTRRKPEREEYTPAYEQAYASGDNSYYNRPEQRQKYRQPVEEDYAYENPAMQNYNRFGYEETATGVAERYHDYLESIKARRPEQQPVRKTTRTKDTIAGQEQKQHPVVNRAEVSKPERTQDLWDLPLPEKNPVIKPPSPLPRNVASRTGQNGR